MSVYTTYEYGTIYEEGVNTTSPSDVILPSKVFNNLWEYLLCENDKSDLGQVFKLCQKSRSRRYIRTQKYVGTIQTKDGTIIEILPKIYKNSGQQLEDAAKCKQIFLRMLASLKSAKAKSFQNAPIGTQKGFPILEVYIRNFINTVENVLRMGLGREYSSIQSNCNCYKGRLIVSENIKRNSTDKARFYVEYKKLSENVAHNRLIVSVLQYLSQVTHSPSNTVKINTLLSMMADIPPSRNIRNDLRIAKTPNRLFSHYCDVISQGEQILQGNGYTTFAGAYVNQSLLFPAEKLFEDFVAHLFKKHLNKFNVSSQHRKYFLVDKHGNMGSLFRLRPDIVAESIDDLNYECVILDTKWKSIDSTLPNKDYLIDMKDMYQLYAYGRKYSEHLSNYRDQDVTPHLVLIYPCTERFFEPLQDFEYESITKEYGLKLKVVPFDLASDNYEMEVQKIIDSLSPRQAYDNATNVIPLIPHNSIEEEVGIAAKRLPPKRVCFDFKNRKDFSSIVADSRVVFNESLLIACYKSHEHLQWIADNLRYNVRAAKRRGAVKNICIAERATRLLLYDKNNPTSYYYFELTDKIESADFAFMSALKYPNLKEGNEYFLYELSRTLDTPNINVKKLIELTKPEGWKPGAPIYFGFSGDVKQLEDIVNNGI